MNVPAKVVATVMVVTVAALVFQSSPAPVSAAAGDAEATATSLILSGVLQGLGKGVGNEVSEQATQWGLSMLGFNPGGSTADIGPELDAIEKTPQPDPRRPTAGQRRPQQPGLRHLDDGHLGPDCHNQRQLEHLQCYRQCYGEGQDQ
jgi:hypothetical protein